MERRRLIKVGLGAAAVLGVPCARAAEQTEIRFARQFSMGYLQFNVMEHRGLVEKHARALGLGDVAVRWVTFNGPDTMNSALISDTVDVVSGGIPGLVTLWARTKGSAQEVRGISALSSQPCLMNTRNPAVHGVADLTDADRIAVPAVKVSIQAVTLQMAAAAAFGVEQYTKLDRLTVSMAPPDATISLLSGGNGGISCAFSVPPYQSLQLEHPEIRTVLNSFDVAGAHSFTVCWTTARFRARNPVLYQALVAALAEATAIVNADKRAAAALWLQDAKSNLALDMVAGLVAGPQVSWTMVPQGTLTYAAFMQKAGAVKVAPAGWEEMFFPEMHGLGGS